VLAEGLLNDALIEEVGLEFVAVSELTIILEESDKVHK